MERKTNKKLQRLMASNIVVAHFVPVSRYSGKLYSHDDFVPLLPKHVEEKLVEHMRKRIEDNIHSAMCIDPGLVGSDKSVISTFSREQIEDGIREGKLVHMTTMDVNGIINLKAIV